MLTRCAVLGRPIAHSLSPVLHRAAYDVLGLTGWSYDAVEVDEADLADFVAGLGDEWRGLSLTMPLKRVVLGLLDSVSPVVEASGAANTVLLGDGLRIGENTDVPGAVDAVRERFDGPVRHAVVVGGGATASSMLVALGELGAESVMVLARDPARAEAAVRGAAQHLRATVSVGPLPGPPLAADLVVSTVPGSAQTPDLLARLAPAPVVFEAVYDGWPTPLASAAPRRGPGAGLRARPAGAPGRPPGRADGRRGRRALPDGPARHARRR